MHVFDGWLPLYKGSNGTTPNPLITQLLGNAYILKDYDVDLGISLLVNNIHSSYSRVRVSFA